MPQTRTSRPASGPAPPGPAHTRHGTPGQDLASEQAATVVEYAVMLALMIVVMLAGIILLGGNLSTMFDTIVNAGWAESTSPP